MKAATLLKAATAVQLQEKMSLGSSVFLLTFLRPTKCGFLLYLGKRELPLVLEPVPFLSDREGRGCSY